MNLLINIKWPSPVSQSYFLDVKQRLCTVALRVSLARSVVDCFWGSRRHPNGWGKGSLNLASEQIQQNSTFFHGSKVAPRWNSQKRKSNQKRMSTLPHRRAHHFCHVCLTLTVSFGWVKKLAPIQEQPEDHEQVEDRCRRSSHLIFQVINFKNATTNFEGCLKRISEAAGDAQMDEAEFHWT